MNELHFELVVLGTGPSGGTVATKIARQDRHVAIIESREFGGTCALRGCNPKKVYTNAGSLVDQVRRATGTLLANTHVEISWTQLQSFKETFTRPVGQKSESPFQDDGIATFHGTAKFIGPSQLIVGDMKLSANRILISTGATPGALAFAGSEHVTYSDDFFELKTIPKKVLFIGGGYISMEFAHVVARCNIETTIVERDSMVLAGFDASLVELLVDYSKRQGIDFRLNRELLSIHPQSDGSLQVTLDNGDTIDVGLVVHGAGRVPNIKDLELDAAGIEYGDEGIAVDSYLRSTSNRNVFATGDCAASGMPQLTPVANEEARIVAKNLFTNTHESMPDYGVVPKVVFTTPAIASIGLSQQDAQEKSARVDVRMEDTSSWGSNRKTGATVSGYKVLIDKDTDQILGAHLLGPAAEETINLFALAMKHGLTAKEMKSTLFAFPTFASDVRQML